jgi:Cu+-exporting ATPase
MTSKVNVKVGGMSCDNCRRHVERALGKVAGVTDMAVDLPAGRAHFSATVEATTAAVEAIRKAGYQAEVLEN